MSDTSTDTRATSLFAEGSLKTASRLIATIRRTAYDPIGLGQRPLETLSLRVFEFGSGSRRDRELLKQVYFELKRLKIVGYCGKERKFWLCEEKLRLLEQKEQVVLQPA